MDNLLWYVIMIPCSALFSGLGIYAWNRKHPMGFWAGTPVKDDEISDIPAYNHANGILWGAYSLIYWEATVAGIWSGTAAILLIAAGVLPGLPLLMAAYRRICDRYRVS